MNVLYDVTILKRDKREAHFRYYATDRDDAVAFIKRVTRNTIKSVVSAARVKRTR